MPFTKLRTAIAFVLALSAIQHSASAIDMSEITESMDTIIVIGEKTERSLKDTASSVSVISEETLRTMQHQTITDAVSEITNVVALSGAVPDIRGVSGNGSAGGFNSISGGAKARVSILIDGVAEPFVADLTGDSGIWDIEQIEVYRGPQSTSNGRNSIGGSIYIKTADPTFDWQGAARVGYRNQDSYIDTSAMISGPLIEDKLAFRLTAQHLDAETITDDTEFATNPADYDLNEIRTNRYKGKLLWAAADNLNLLLTHSSNSEQGDTGRIYFEAVDVEDHKRIFFRDISTESDATSLKLDWQLNETISFDVLLAVMDYEWGFDSYEANAARQQILRFDESNVSLDAKLNFGLANDDLHGFVGLAYSEREQDVISGGAFAYGGDDESESAAIYGEVSYALNEVFKLTLGGRLQRESQLRNFTFAPIVAQLDKSNNIFLPKLVLQYDLSEQTKLALSAKRGYNAAGGALNFTAQEYYFFDEETVDSYEFSVRSSNEAGNIDLTANVFYNNYDGYQALSSTRFITNMDEVVTYGAELEAVFRPTADLQFKAGLGWLKTKIEDAGAGYAAANGNELNSAPNITANLSAKYWLNNNLNFGISVHYVDEYYGDFNNTDGRVAGGYMLTRLNANYEIDNWTVSAFVNNATDETELTSREPAGGRYPKGYAAVVAPRNLGVSVSYSF